MFVWFVPFQSNVNFETKRSKSEKKNILVLFITFYKFLSYWFLKKIVILTSLVLNKNYKVTPFRYCHVSVGHSSRWSISWRGFSHLHVWSGNIHHLRFFFFFLFFFWSIWWSANWVVNVHPHKTSFEMITGVGHVCFLCTSYAGHCCRLCHMCQLSQSWACWKDDWNILKGCKYLSYMTFNYSVFTVIAESALTILMQTISYSKYVLLLLLLIFVT